MLSFIGQPDRLWRLRPGGFVPPKDTLVAGRWRHADRTNELVALDIGARSNHTDHYLVSGCRASACSSRATWDS